jgi:hypothetical protein
VDPTCEHGRMADVALAQFVAMVGPVHDGGLACHSGRSAESRKRCR